jgi:hypothetical protein
MQAATKVNVWLYRRTSGRVGGRGMDKWPLLLLTVPGRRSGDTAHGAGCRLRAQGQISRCREGHGWLQENTAVVSESPVCRSGPNPYPEREHKVNPHVADDAERAQVWEQIATAAHSFVRFQVRTGRGFPIWPSRFSDESAGAPHR